MENLTPRGQRAGSPSTLKVSLHRCTVDAIGVRKLRLVSKHGDRHLHILKSDVVVNTVITSENKFAPFLID